MISFHIPPFPTFIKGAEGVFRKGDKHFKRTFSVFDFIYVKSGTLHMTEDKQAYSISEGEYIILLPGLEHFGHQVCAEDTSIYWLHFSMDDYQIVNKQSIDWSDIIKRESSFTESDYFNFYLPRYGKFQSKMALEQQLKSLIALNKVASPEERLKQQTLFYDFIIQLQKDAIHIPSAAEQVTSKVIEYLQKNYHQSIKMDDLSKALLYHPDYIVRSMKKTIGISPMQYLTQYRLFIAKQELVNSSNKISAIANKIGIDDSAYFSKLFKKEVGVSATQYQRLSKRKNSLEKQN
ncbi:AraC family transcriptional regulator [Bacillus taeanensis]|uniref:AraC family transcriptional regulator n=1 Tax=Bacillus taeanensis TaxID=273032 RepID=A0A366XZD3_9BACI|nr:AraC family transcriptional regulator [Bacillus taeanensis]RBW69513.1 AraC family transcriptional regulator [Bacillus taeanensis]